MSDIYYAFDRAHRSLTHAIKQMGVTSEQAHKALIRLNIAQLKADLADPSVDHEAKERLIVLLAYWEAQA